MQTLSVQLGWMRDAPAPSDRMLFCCECLPIKNKGGDIDHMGASLGSSFCFLKCSFLKHPSHVDIKRFLDFVLQVSNVS